MPAAINYEKLKSDYDRLKTGLKELAILNEIATTINSTLEVDKITGIIVKKCIKHFHVEQGNISLIKEPEIARPLQTMVRQYDSDAGIIPFRIDQQLIGWMLTKKEPLVINNLALDQRFGSLARETTYNSILAVPMLYKGKIIGVLSLFNKSNLEEFSNADLRLLTIIATQSAQVIENARLLEEEKKLYHVIEELKIAGEIQQQLLPAQLPAIKNYSIAAINIPAREVGGDYYDVIELENNRYAVCFGDVSGKGISAGLLMSNIHATMRSLLLSQATPSECVRKANKLMYATTTIYNYITFFHGILDLNDNSFLYCNAGHDAPLFIKNGTINELITGGIPLGVMKDFDYRQDRVFFDAEDILLIYTDGVTECFDKNENEFKLEQVKKILLENRLKSPKELKSSLLKAIGMHSEGMEQMDDITFMVLKKD
jgi:sigma-B regulation protein RsbU (phosphoserine phosphatase)